MVGLSEPDRGLRLVEIKKLKRQAPATTPQSLTLPELNNPIILSKVAK